MTVPRRLSFLGFVVSAQAALQREDHRCLDVIETPLERRFAVRPTRKETFDLADGILHGVGRHMTPRQHPPQRLCQRCPGLARCRVDP